MYHSRIHPVKRNAARSNSSANSLSNGGNSLPAMHRAVQLVADEELQGDRNGSAFSFAEMSSTDPGQPTQFVSNIVQKKPALGMNEHFRYKHRAKDKKKAQEAADYYGGTVTVIKNKKGPQDLVDRSNVTGTKFEIPSVTAWKFVGGTPKPDEAGTAKGAVDDAGMLLHMDGIF